MCSELLIVNVQSVVLVVFLLLVVERLRNHIHTPNARQGWVLGVGCWMPYYGQDDLDQEVMCIYGRI